MMNDQPVIRFDNVSKRFAFTPGNPQTVLETFTSLLSRRGKRAREQDLWAVRDVSFEVRPGQCLGIIGRNGSGKSTILKLMARILRPTAGRILITGRVSALLELGAGFHPDLTGRENIYLNASILGLEKREVDAAFDEIVAFSELEEFIDMQVKHYSSGMYMRLGFSVAIHVKPDILIVDEILAVGDQAFQAKCLDQIYKMQRRGITIIIVSHNLETVYRLCSHLLWIESGRVRCAGTAADVAEAYLGYLYQWQEQHEERATDSTRENGRPRLKITAVRFLDAHENARASFTTGEPMTVEVSYMVDQPVFAPAIGLSILRQDGVRITLTENHLGDAPTAVIRGPGVIRYMAEHLPLLPASYRLVASLFGNQEEIALDSHTELFRVVAETAGHKEVEGIVDIPARWEWLTESAEETLALADG